MQAPPPYPGSVLSTKAHGTGNDFVVVPDWDARLDLTPALVRAICDRHTGLGADGILRIVAGGDGVDAVMDHRNADGSRAEMCGNGIRVVAKYVADHGLARPVGGALRIDTRAGTKLVQLSYAVDGTVDEVTVDMGPPAVATVDEALDVDGEKVLVTTVSMGNPHAVLVVEDVADAPVASLGRAIEHHPRFPDRTNVEFVHVTGPATADVRVWERGVGETMACGTGACAVLAALQALELTGDGATLRFPGGDLVVRYGRGDDGVLLTGPAVEVADIQIRPGWFEAHR